ncbi:MAG: hypothetical protein ACN4GW_21030, partial [Desulforhopalus sp.]
MTWVFTLYLLYGLAFFTLGIAIFSRQIKLSELGIARILHMLAIFGIIHGVHEWLELLQQLQPSLETPAFVFFRLVIVAVSFFFLFYFGLFLNIITLFGYHALENTPFPVKSLIAALLLVAICSTIYMDYSTGQDIYIRRFIAFPGGILSGIGLILYSRTVRPLSLAVARNFILAGIFMCCYALLTGIFPSDMIVPFIQLEIILLRGVSAFFIMIFTIRG